MKPYIKSINISVTTQNSEVFIKFMKPEKIKDIIEDKEILLSDFIKSIISNSALSDEN